MDLDTHLLQNLKGIAVAATPGIHGMDKKDINVLIFIMYFMI